MAKSASAPSVRRKKAGSTTGTEAVPTIVGVDSSALYAISVGSNLPPADLVAVLDEVRKNLPADIQRAETVAWLSSPAFADERFERYRSRVAQTYGTIIDNVGAFSYVADLRDVMDSARLSDAQRTATRLRVQRADPSIAYMIGLYARTHQIAVVTDSIQVGLTLAGAGRLRSGKNFFCPPAGAITTSAMQSLRAALESSALSAHLEVVELDRAIVFPSRDRKVERVQAPTNRQLFPTFK